MARRRSPVFVGRTNYPNIEGLEALMRGIAALPDEIVREVKPEVSAAAEAMVKRYKRRAPVSKLETRKGALRDSAHTESGRHELAVQVIVDAKDDQGRFIAKHVEHGHLASDGSHVPPVPAFWPAYRATKTPFRRGVGRALKRAVAAIEARIASTRR